MIENYNFGKITINSIEYTSDIILFGNNVHGKWWRKKGHELCIADIEQFIEKYQPAIVIVGTGKFNIMQILPETKEYMAMNNIELISQNTEKASVSYNNLYQKKKVLGAFHLTC